MQLISFDFHNTLAHCDLWFELEVFTLASRVARDLELDVDTETVNRSYREIRAEVMRTGREMSATRGARLALARNGHELDVRPVQESVDRLMHHALVDLVPVAGAIETVQHLHARGYSLGVISSAAHHDFLEWALESFGIRDAFAFVLTSVGAGMYKSKPELYRHALSLVDADARKSLHVGDSLKWDVSTASLAGMHTAWLVSDQRGAIDIQPDLEFDSLQDAGPTIDRFVRGLR